jgi:hypothetical protein
VKPWFDTLCHEVLRGAPVFQWRLATENTGVHPLYPCEFDDEIQSLRFNMFQLTTYAAYAAAIQPGNGN